MSADGTRWNRTCVQGFASNGAANSRSLVALASPVPCRTRAVRELCGSRSCRKEGERCTEMRRVAGGLVAHACTLKPGRVERRKECLAPPCPAADRVRNWRGFRTFGSCRSGVRLALRSSIVRVHAPCRNAARPRRLPDRPRPASGSPRAPLRAGVSRPSALAADKGAPGHRVPRQIPSERAVRGMFQLVHRVVTPCVWAEGFVVPYLSDSEPKGIHVRH